MERPRRGGPLEGTGARRSGTCAVDIANVKGGRVAAANGYRPGCPYDNLGRCGESGKRLRVDGRNPKLQGNKVSWRHRTRCREEAYSMNKN